MDYPNFKGIPLKPEEKIVKEARVSTSGLVVIWASVPTLMLVTFITTYVIPLFTTIFSRAAKAAMLEALGVSSMSKVNVFKYVFDQTIGRIPTVIIVLICIPVVMLALAWLCVCLFMTSRHYRYSLAITDIRVIGRSGDDEMAESLSDVSNVFIEQSLWGKLFNYGNITVQTKRKALTFYSIHKPRDMYRLLMSYAENYVAH